MISDLQFSIRFLANTTLDGSLTLAISDIALYSWLRVLPVKAQNNFSVYDMNRAIVSPRKLRSTLVPIS